jgi:hypothetical protein
MIRMKLKDAKKFFWNVKVIMEAVGVAEEEKLRKGAGLIRKIAQRSMRPGSKRAAAKIQQIYAALAHAHGEEKDRLRDELRSLQKESSAPAGQPPRTWTRLLKDLLLFVWDPSSNSALVGPALSNSQDGEDVPHVLEFGGNEIVTRGRRHKTKRAIKVNPHPYMGPALEKARPELAGMWADSIKA